MRLRLPLAIALVSVLGAAAAARAADEFVVIVHPSVTGASIRRADLAAVFLKKAPRWSGGGGLAVPVDQSGTAPVRKAFSEKVVLRQPVAAGGAVLAEADDLAVARCGRRPSRAPTPR